MTFFVTMKICDVLIVTVHNLSQFCHNNYIVTKLCSLLPKKLSQYNYFLVVYGFGLYRFGSDITKVKNKIFEVKYKEKHLN